VAELTANDNPAVSQMNLHFALQEERVHGRVEGGPRVLVCGPANSGKTTLVRTLVALAGRSGSHPMLVNTDPRDGMLSLPGTLSAAVFGSLMDVESPDGGIGVGGTPCSGPSAIPAKLPLVYYFGKAQPEDDLSLWKELVSSLARAAVTRADQDKAVKSAGMIIDSPPVGAGQGGVDMLSHAVNGFGGGLTSHAENLPRSDVLTGNQ
jgi:polyribonucleotide 5'-hydroxyl-kinase